jgi:membrane protease YdiL (CAAX protease family)
MFYNPSERRLRALWRLLLHGAILFAFGALLILAVAEPMHALGVKDREINMVLGPLLTLAVIASVAIAARWIDKRPFAQLGLAGRWSDLAKGIAIGGVLMAFVFAIQLGMGWIEITGFGLPLAYTVVKVICVGTYEELISRGYHLVNLAEGTNVPTAIVSSAAFFALLHLMNENASAMSVIGIFVNALLFTVARLMSGSLAMPIGLHMAWNFFQGAVFGFPVSGDKEGASLIAIRQLGPDLVTGGAFGPEAGVLGIGASLLGIVWVGTRHRN